MNTNEDYRMPDERKFVPSICTDTSLPVPPSPQGEKPGSDVLERWRNGEDVQDSLAHELRKTRTDLAQSQRQVRELVEAIRYWVDINIEIEAAVPPRIERLLAKFPPPTTQEQST